MTIFQKDSYHSKEEFILLFQVGLMVGVELNRLLYIGMACERSISECIHDHTVNHHDKWIADHCKKNENIYYRVANLESGIQEAWFSLINRLNPPCNSLKSRDFNDNCLIHNINIDFSDIDS